jgi:hypothetical protein
MAIKLCAEILKLATVRQHLEMRRKCLLTKKEKTLATQGFSGNGE